MTERELIDRTAAEAAALEVDATAAADDDEHGGLATAETTTAFDGRAATHRADAMPGDAIAVVGARRRGAEGGCCPEGGAAGGRRGGAKTNSLFTRSSLKF